VQQHQENAAGSQKPDQGAPGQHFIGVADDARRVDEIEHGQQQGANG
jgi:hypothetical protein